MTYNVSIHPSDLRVRLRSIPIMFHGRADVISQDSMVGNRNTNRPWTTEIVRMEQRRSGHKELTTFCVIPIKRNITTKESAKTPHRDDASSIFIFKLSVIFRDSRSIEMQQFQNLVSGQGETRSVLAAGLCEERLAAAAAFDALGGFANNLSGVVTLLYDVIA